MSKDSGSLLFRRVPLSLYRQIDRRSLEVFIGTVAEEVGQGNRFTCLLTNDGELRRLNREFLSADYPTDVLSFPSGNGATTPLGDLAISVERAAEQARDLGHSLNQEVAVLILHGMLHLLGMDHENPRDRGRMRRVESEWRRRLSLPAGLIERTGT